MRLVMALSLSGFMMACGTSGTQDLLDDDGGGCTMHCEPCQGQVEDEDTLDDHSFGSVDGTAYIYLQLVHAGSCVGLGNVMFHMRWNGLTLTAEQGAVYDIEEIAFAEWDDGGWYKYSDQDLRARTASIDAKTMRIHIEAEGATLVHECVLQPDETVLCTDVTDANTPPPMP